MTPAIVLAKKAGVDFTIHDYKHDPAVSSYGEEAASALGLSFHQVFKTLLVSTQPDNSLVVAIIPVDHKLDLKKLAKQLGVKKLTMAKPHEAEKASGYIVGGISPLGQKKRLPCVLDESAFTLETIFVSAGKRGLEIELPPADLIRLCNAKLADIKAK